MRRERKRDGRKSDAMWMKEVPEKIKAVSGRESVFILEQTDC